MLTVGKSTGRTALIPEWAVEFLTKNLVTHKDLRVMKKLDDGWQQN